MPEWMGGEEAQEPLTGERISVLAHDSRLQADPLLNDIEIRIPEAETVNSWTLQKTPPSQHPSLKSRLSNTKTISIGEGAKGGFRITSAPIIAGGVIYALDADGVITARSINNIEKVLWQTQVEEKQMQEDLLGIGFDVGFGNRTVKKEFLGGNIAYGNKAVFVTTGRGGVAAYGSVTGTPLWQRSVKIPIKSAPVVYEDNLFLITSDNSLYALDSKTGKTLWTSAGIKEMASMMGASSPVVEGGIAVVPYSSGELHAFKIATGSRIWSELLVSSSATSGSSISLSDIDANPVIARGKVYAVSHDGILSSVDLYSGSRLWSQDISSVNTPWIAGNFLFIITTDYDLICVQAQDGKIKWVEELPTNDSSVSIFGKDKKGKPIVWSGPVLAGGRLLVVGSHGKMASYSPHTGRLSDVVDVEKNIFIPPVIADDSIFLLSNDAKLTVIY